MQNAGLDESQAGIMIARRNINNLRCTDDTTLMAEGKEELKRLLMKVKEESGKMKNWPKTQQWPQDWERSVFIPIPKKGNAKEGSNYHTIALISHTNKIMLKILQVRLQQYMN